VLTSKACKYEDFLSEWYARWAKKLGFPFADVPELAIRKIWEYCAILQVLEERGKLVGGSTGLGFAVGKEPLSSAMASMGAMVLASDLAINQSSSMWLDTQQHAASLDSLYHENIVDRATFERNVAFQNLDMNDLPLLPGRYDFLWSSCAFEHLGSLEKGLAFVINSLQYLKPGGIAVHTTEFNCSSNTDTIATGASCIYRRSDLENLDMRLRSLKCGIERMEFDIGTHPNDLNYDTAPYFSGGRPHVKLKLDGYICTSYLLIIHKA
jgi:Methyltransferase domain